MSSILTTGLLQTSKLLGLSASGGTINKVGAYTYHTFSATGTFTVQRYCGLTFEYLVIAGGGGGAGHSTGPYPPGGGGGAGRAFSSSTFRPRNTSFTVTVGNGGTPGMENSNGGNGGLSIFIIPVAGGKGGTTQSDGGNSGNNYLGGEGTGYRIAGGGAGCSGNGYNGDSVGHQGEGGPGSTWNGYGFGGGGAGGSDIEELKPEGGNFGGGAGATSYPSIEGTPRTGAGGGGGNTTYPSGAAGGSGVIIIRYLTP